MLIKNMEYLSQRLRCTDEEKDACLETVTVLLHFWTDVRKNGVLAIGGDRAKQDPNPFFRTCLLDAIEWIDSEDEPLLEELFAQYLIAGGVHRPGAPAKYGNRRGNSGIFEVSP